MKGWGLNVYPVLSIFSGLDELPVHWAQVSRGAPPFGRSKRTVAQDQRAAAKRRAVRLAKKRGQA
jgi:hypothetical protein